MVAEIRAVAPLPDPEDEAAVDTGEDLSLGPILRLTTSQPHKERRVIVFYIDDGAYSVPAAPGADLGLRVMDVAARQGQQAAAVYMLREMLGEDGYTALMNYKGLTAANLASVVARINTLAMGSLEVPKES